MKRKIKFLSFLFCILISSVLLTACEFGLASGSVDENVDPIPSEISVEGFSAETTVGQGFYSTLKVKQKLNGEWQEVVKTDYAVSCEYDGTKYGDYTVKVYLVKYPHVKYETSLLVKPLTVEIPIYSTVYTGEGIDIKSALEENSDGLYRVSKYTNEVNVGTYSASLTLTNPNKYCWVDGEGNLLKGYTKTIDWTITKAPAKEYLGETEIVVFYADTLYDVALENNLQYITWVDSDKTLVTNQSSVSAIYNESPGNYEDTHITITFSEIITTANYAVEYYFFDGNMYSIDVNRSVYNNSDTIGQLITLATENIDGYTLNHYLSNPAGKVLKDGSLVLKLYYDPTN